MSDDLWLKVARDAARASALHEAESRAELEASGAHAWHPPMDVSSEGAVRIAGPSAAVFEGRSGAFDVLVIAARPGALPDEAHALDVGATERERRVARVHVTIAP